MRLIFGSIVQTPLATSIKFITPKVTRLPSAIIQKRLSESRLDHQMTNKEYYSRNNTAEMGNASSQMEMDAIEDQYRKLNALGFTKVAK